MGSGRVKYSQRCAVLLASCAIVIGLLDGGACLSLPTGEGATGSAPPPPLVEDSLTGTWLVSVDTANLAPFEVFLFKAAGDSGAHLLGVTRVPDFASRMGLNVIQPGSLGVTLAGQIMTIQGVLVGQRPLLFVGSRCGQNLCGALE